MGRGDGAPRGCSRGLLYSGAALGDQWPGSRAIAIEKANTANALSLPPFAFFTANLHSAAQPSGFLYGTLKTNPVDTKTMYAGDSAAYGAADDPMVGRKASGVVVFGGSLALYDGSAIAGAPGVSEDTSPGDHHIAWPRDAKAPGRYPNSRIRRAEEHPP